MLRKEKTIMDALRAYSKLELLSSLYNESIGRYFLSRFNTTTAVSSIASAFLFVKLFSLHDIFITGMSLGCGAILMTTFTSLAIFCSRVHTDSNRLRRTLLKKRVPSTALNKQFKCYKVIGVKIGSFFLVKRGTPLTMLAMISNTTMSLLISVHFSI